MIPADARLLSRANPACRRLALGTLVLAACAVALAADVPLTQRSADAFQRKLLGIQQYATSAQGGARLTPVTEAELNSYLRLSLTSEIPSGVVEPYVVIVGEGEIRARAVVDLDAVRRSKPRGWLDPLAYLTGRLPVTASGRLTSQGGRAQFALADATVSGLSVPKAALQELVTFYSRSADNPSGIDLEAPFDLPARIQEIHVEPGQAVVVQR
jgi:hypothetical protein